MGEVTATNTDKVPYFLPPNGIRLMLTKGTEMLTVAVSCPMVGNSILVRAQLANEPGTLVCEFKSPIEAAWKKASAQAQMQTLLSATFDVDSGMPQAYDFDASSAQIQSLYQGECVNLQLTRVTQNADLQSANANPAVATLAKSLGGDRFKVLPMSAVKPSVDSRVPPAATDRRTAPLVVCGNETVAWRETYGPFSEYDCGPNMVSLSIRLHAVCKHMCCR